MEELLVKPTSDSPKKVTVTTGQKQTSIETNPGGRRTKTGWNEHMDEVEYALHAQWKPVFVEMMELSAKVGDLAREGKSDPYKKVAAGQMALRILDLDDLCDAFYDQREFYLKNGKLPDSRPYGEPCIDPNLIPSKLENHKRYAREYKTKLDADPCNLNAAAQLKKHEWFVDHYKKTLKKS